MKLRIVFSSLFLLLLLIGCEKNEAYKEVLNDPELYHATVKKLTDVIVYDIFSPPVASRVYMYPNVAAYAVMQQANSETYNAIEPQLTGLEAIPQPDSEDIDFNLAAFYAHTVVGKQLIFSEDRITDFQEKTIEELKTKGLPQKVLDASLAYGESVAKHILKSVSYTHLTLPTTSRV